MTIKKIIAILDKNKSGTINLQEFKILYPEKTENFFDEFDLNHNGEIDSEEFEKFIKTKELATELLIRCQRFGNFTSLIICVEKFY